jgi:nucleoside-triphosphatase THEP1
MPEVSAGRTGTRGQTTAWLMLLVGCIALQYPARLELAGLGLGAWLAALALFDRAALARMWHPRFLLITAIVALMSGLLLGTPDTRLFGVRVSSEGFTAGGLMFIRAVLLIGVSAWASRKLVSGAAHSTWGLPGASLSAAADLAMELVPALTTRVRERWSRQTAYRGRGMGAIEKTAVELVFQVACVAEGLARPSPIAATAAVVRLAVVGPSGSGKTSTLRLLRDALAQSGLRVEGVLQPAARVGHLVVSYGLEDAATGERRPFASREGQPAGDPPRFDPAGWEWSAARIRSARQWGDVVIVDELGLIEGTGSGHVAALLATVPLEQATVWLLAVRDSALDLVAQRIGAFDFVLSPTDEPAAVAAYAAQILEARRLILAAGVSAQPSR